MKTDSVHITSVGKAGLRIYESVWLGHRKVSFVRIKRVNFRENIWAFYWDKWNCPCKAGVRRSGFHKAGAPLPMVLAMFPRQLFSAVLGMDLARTLDPCHLIRSPKTDDLSRQKSIFLLTSVSLTFVVVCYLLLPGEIYFTALWWSYGVVHWAGSEKSIQEPASRPLQLPFSLYPATFLFLRFRKFFLLFLWRHMYK